MTAELEGSLPSRSNILSKFVGTILVLMNSPSALVLIYENVGLWHKVKLDPLYPWMRPCEIGQDKVIWSCISPISKSVTRKLFSKLNHYVSTGVNTHGLETVLVSFLLSVLCLANVTNLINTRTLTIVLQAICLSAKPHHHPQRLVWEGLLVPWEKTMEQGTCHLVWWTQRHRTLVSRINPELHNIFCRRSYYTSRHYTTGLHVLQLQRLTFSCRVLTFKDG
jgi:hypothetical protein